MKAQSFLTIAQAAQRLSCSPSFVRDMVRAKDYAGKPVEIIPPRLRKKVRLEFPSVRIQGLGIRIPEHDFNDWVIGIPHEENSDTKTQR